MINEQTILNNRCFFISESVLPSIDYAFKPINKDDEESLKKNLPTKRITWKSNLFIKSQEVEWRKLAFKALKKSYTEDENVT